MCIRDSYYTGIPLSILAMVAIAFYPSGTIVWLKFDGEAAVIDGLPVFDMSGPEV